MKLLIILLFCSSVFAQTPIVDPQVHQENEKLILPGEVPPEVSPVEKVIEEAKPLPGPAAPDSKVEQVLNSRTHRGNSTGTIMVGYQLVTSWLPSKKTISYTHNFNEAWSLEGEYSWADISVPSFIGFDLGGVKEKRYTLQARRFVGNSFHFTFGGVYSEFEAGLGGSVADQFGNDISGEVGAENLGVTGGMGNRWQWGNGFTLGIDWLRINIPVVDTRNRDNIIKRFGNEGDQEDVKKVIRGFNRIPTFVLFGLNLGYSF